HGEALRAIQHDYPDDIVSAPSFLREPPFTHGDPYGIGDYPDEWGCIFENIQEGVIGEVKRPQVQDWARDAGREHMPREWLSVDTDAVNRWCGESDRFVLAGCCPRPFEQLQFLRGTEDLYRDLLLEPDGFPEFFAAMHRFYCDVLELWATTDVDGLMFMDDWGSQRNLLIDPALWRELFKPLYRDYIQIAHGRGKRAFMHSDGYILPVYPDLVDLGLDALNSQVFCMGVDQLAAFAGRITFWGEIDRQHLLPDATTAEIDAAVSEVHRALWRRGGCIAQCEFGPAARPENVRQVFASWERLATGG
ncbi:MAG: methyltransferase, partial [Candidatus Hydrogenedentes bacterium]|nr:methyltransferase [Candidatus Hydrogenedentota bacterium]